MKFTPLGDRILVEKMKEETSNGIVLPPSAQKSSGIARVIAVGPGKMEDGKLMPAEVKVGDKVLYGEYSGVGVDLGDDHQVDSKHVVLRFDDILGVFTD